MRVLNRKRIILAFAIALAADTIQIALGPFGVILVDQVVDVVAMVLIAWVIGFHPLLLPTFILELIPVVEMIPTWTLCTAIVVGLRRRQPASSAPTAVNSAPVQEQRAPVYSESGILEPPPIREPKAIQGTDRSLN
jgi:hypothetical protein